MSDEIGTDSTPAEVAARTSDALHREPFIRWFLVRFATRAHFMRMLATLIVGFTITMLLIGRPVPDAWWGVLGMALGYYFRGATAGSTGKDHD